MLFVGQSGFLNRFADTVVEYKLLELSPAFKVVRKQQQLPISRDVLSSAFKS